MRLSISLLIMLMSWSMFGQNCDSLLLEWKTIVLLECHTDKPASRTVQLTDETRGPVDFFWSSGESFSGTVSTATQLSEGDQWVYASDGICESDTLYFEVPRKTNDSLFYFFRRADSPTTCGGNDGFIRVEGTNGVVPYTNVWQDGSNFDRRDDLTEGIYYITVFDANGCTLHDTFPLFSEEHIGLEWKSDIEIDCSSPEYASRSVVRSSPDKGPVDIIWSSGETTRDTLSTATQLESGRQWVYAFDAFCQADTMFFDVPELPTAGSLNLMERNFDHPSCTTGNDGWIELKVEGGVSPYQFLWEDGVDTSFYDQLEVGSYKVTISDALGCSIIDSFMLSSDFTFRAEVDAAFSILDICNGGSSDIQISTNSNAPFFTHDSQGQNLGDQFSLPVGSHRLNVFTDGGCSDEVILEVTETTFRPVFIDPIPMALCGDDNFELQVESVSSSEVLQSSLNNEDWDYTTSQSLDTGTYELFIHSIEGCVWDTTFTISEEDIVINPVDSIIRDRPAEFSILASTIDGISFEWESINPFFCLEADCPVIQIQANESEIIQLTATTPAGCILRDSIVLIVREDTVEPPITTDDFDEFYIPNIVNSVSSLNSNLCVSVTEEVSSVDVFTLYDRWGNIALGPISGDGESICFDQLKLRELSLDVYVYLLRLVTIDGQSISVTGDVTVIR